MMILRHCLVLALFMLPVADAIAITCDAVFSNAVGTTGGKLDLKAGTTLLNTGDRVLATRDLKLKGGAGNCDNAVCIESGSAAPTLTIPPNKTKTDLKDQSLSLAPGDYYFDKFELKNSNTITLTGSGQVRIHVAGDLKIGDRALVNVDGDPLDLVFLVGGKVEITGDSQVSAVIYSDKKITVEDNAAVEGAVVGKDAEVKDAATIRYVPTGTLEIAGVCEIGMLPLHHIRLLHDGIGVIGAAETVTVQACANADCSQLVTGSISVTLQPVDANTAWSGSGVVGSQLTFAGGTQAVTLHRSSAGIVNIGAATPAALNPTRCFVAAVETCAIVYPATAFVVTLPDQVAGAQSVGSVTVPICWSDFQSRSVSLEVTAQYLSPVWTGPAVTVNGVALPTDGTGVTIDPAFDASCTASLQVVYQDAGEIGVNLSFVGSGDLNGLTILGGDSPVFYPAALVAQAATAGGTLLDAVAAGTGPVHAAGEDFALTVSAVNAAGVVTRGYRPQAADRLRAYVQRTGPMAGYEGVLNISAGGSVGTLPSVPSGPGDYVDSGVQPGDFVDGVYAYPAASYSEVGLLTLYLLDSDYLGQAIAASPLPVGRFVPAGFQASGSVLNRFATAGCVGSSFTYMGEGLRLGAQLTALNRMGVVTRNYQGGFAAFDGSGFGAFAGAAGNTVGALAAAIDLSGRLVLNGVALSVPWAAGTATLDIDLALQAGPAPDGPYDATVLGLAFSDADGVALQGLDTDIDGDGAMDHLGLGATGLRYGRLSVGNAHGSELRDLAVPIAMQYFAGSGLGFTTHTVDNCTPIAATLLSDADPGDALLVSDTCIVDQFAASGANACPPGTPGTQYSATAAAGNFSASLKAPGAGKTGGLRVNVDVPTWAQFDWSGTGSGDPSGIATFGIYNRSTDFIYQRELR